MGADRIAQAFLCDAYDEETVGEGDVRTVTAAPSRPGALQSPCAAPLQS